MCVNMKRLTVRYVHMCIYVYAQYIRRRLERAASLTETIEFICFISIALLFIHVYNNARDNRPRLTRSAIL
jgi:hypothetical protein